jgi:hypothetical protein
VRTLRYFALYATTSPAAYSGGDRKKLAQVIVCPLLGYSIAFFSACLILEDAYRPEEGLRSRSSVILSRAAFLRRALPQRIELPLQPLLEIW